MAISRDQRAMTTAPNQQNSNRMATAPQTESADRIKNDVEQLRKGGRLG